MESPHSTHAIDTIVEQAIEARVFPGAVVLVIQHGSIAHYSAYGTTIYDQPDQAVALDTVYDVASLTKMFTATAALRLIEHERIALDMPVQALLPRFRSPNVTLWHLLTHTSGIDIRLSVLRDRGRTGLLETVYATLPQRTPGSAVAYTNVNSLLLGELIVALAGAPLDQAIHELVIAPLGLRDTLFCPPASLLPRIAPTEYDDTWRAVLVHGTVHDESAHALGGIAGHAGLFSTAQDIGAFCQVWLDARTDRAIAPVLSHDLAHHATTNQTAGLQVASGLGWMMDRPNFMGAAFPGSFGHTGFTGPAMVVLPKRETIVVVLNNRVYPRRGPSSHHAVIAAIVEAAM